ncbi:MAG: BatD family protein [Anaerolineae bacterium]|nr:BatD family protein [Anaerolineae bacterium]MDW8171397.1 BatD family protein [Anaerolineae bacterium]
MARLNLLCGLLTLLTAAAFAQTSALPSDRLVARLDQMRPFVGQPIAYTVEIYDAGYATGRVYTPPSFIGFGQQPQAVPPARPVLVDGQSYTLLSQTTLLYPLYPGLVTIEPAQLDVPGDSQRPSLNLRSEAFTLEVRPLPPDPPSTFRNAIGTFSLQASLSRAEIRIGSDVALSLVVQGTGNLERLLPPELNLPEGWRAVLGNQSVNKLDIYSGRKTFTWTLYPDPRSAGLVTLPPILFSAFNPQTEHYETRSTDPLTLTIVGRPVSTAAPLPTLSAVLSVFSLDAQEAVDVEAPARASEPLWLALLAPPPLLFALVVLLTRRGVKAPGAPRAARAVRAAPADQRSRLQAARVLPPLQACAEVAQVLQALQADAAFQAWPDAAKRRLLTLLKTAQAAPYAPLKAADSAALVDETLTLLDALSRRTTTKSKGQP